MLTAERKVEKAIKEEVVAEEKVTMVLQKRELLGFKNLQAMPTNKKLHRKRKLKAVAEIEGSSARARQSSSGRSRSMS